eukprot:m.30717 g.30717  ORF g.30717 m.30717 type:complete len:391 (-) comp8232_c0_seq1:27-1199(-)
MNLLVGNFLHEVFTNKMKLTNVIGIVWMFVMALILFGALPWGIYELHKYKQDEAVTAWFIAGVFVCLTLPTSIWDVAMHIEHYRNPKLQRHIIRILWMVPIYSVDSWLALRFPGAAIYLDTMRECYEAYVIYNFYALMMGYLKQRDPDYLQHAKERDPTKHIFPMCCLPRWQSGEQFFYWIRSGPISYVLFRILLTVIALICELSGSYHEGSIKPQYAFIWIAGINSLTQAWAMYCLILFFVTFKTELASSKPLPKLLVIKAVVFFSFWQAVTISFLAANDVIRDLPRRSTYNTKGEIAAALQDFIICFEMFIYAIVHHYVFSYTEFYVDGKRPLKMSFREKLMHLFTFDDVTEDVIDSVKSVAHLPIGSASQKSPLLTEEPKNYDGNVI